MLAGLLLPKGFNPWLLHPFPRQSAKDTIGAEWSTGGKCARLAVLTPRRPGELLRPQNVSYSRALGCHDRDMARVPNCGEVR